MEVAAGQLLIGARHVRPDVAAGATRLDRATFDNEQVVDLPAQCNREWVISREEMEQNSSLARAWLALCHKTISIYSAAELRVLRSARASCRLPTRMRQGICWDVPYPYGAMGIDVTVTDEDGRVLHTVLDPRNVLRTIVRDADAGTSCLKFIDPYGDTTFNRSQVVQLLEEMREHRERASAEQAALLTQVEALAERALAEPHLYLKFVGD